MVLVGSVGGLRDACRQQVQIQHLTNNQEGHYDKLCAQLAATDRRNTELTAQLDAAKLAMQQAEAQDGRVQAQYRTYFDQVTTLRW